MFQISGLMVFCGLLAQATALLGALQAPLDPTLPLAVTPDLDLSLTDFSGSLTSALSHGLLSEGLLGSLEKLPLSDALKTEGITSRGLFKGLLGRIASGMPFLNIIDVKITNPQMQDLGLVQSPHGRRLYITIPLLMRLNVNVPLIGSLLKLAVKLNISADILPSKDEQQNIYMVLDSCTYSPGSLEISVLERFVPVPFKGLFKSLSKILPGLVKDKVCPLLKEVLRSLDTTLLEATVDTMFYGLEFATKV
ncbi:BPI fold-containing family A member 1 [Equus caballus]|nr:BPI fold-containing family A member 1 isoform X2 [Equus caballus]XP_023482123.1 BPI fold-containing family A member 1 isoform X2 [Equus caballus]